MEVAEIITEVGSGLNGNYAKLMKVLSSATIAGVLVEHLGRLCRFGFECIEAALRAHGWYIHVMEERSSQFLHAVRGARQDFQPTP